MSSIKIVCWLGVVIGIIGLAAGFITSPTDTWLWLLVGFVFFTGVANGILIWAAAFRVAQTTWTRSVNRLGHSAIAFTPILFLALIVLLAGAKSWAPWIEHPVPVKAAWLNLPFMVIRDIVSLLALWALCFFMVRWSLISDSKKSLTERDHYRLTAISIAAVMFYTIAGSIIAYDFIMSLSPEWYSTVFAPYIWVTNLYLGLAVMVLMAAMLRRRLGAELETTQFQNIGNLLLGFSLFSLGLFFAQYLTIWYENLPSETGFLIVRYFHGQWPWLGWTALILGYGIPFVLLQIRPLKRDPRLLSPVAILIVLGVTLERYVLIVPSIKPDKLLLYPVPGLVILAFLGGFVLTVTAFLGRYSPVSKADAALEVASFELEAAP